jgi:hypothetical protein
MPVQPGAAIPVCRFGEILLHAPVKVIGEAQIVLGCDMLLFRRYFQPIDRRLQIFLRVSSGKVNGEFEL